MPRWAPGVSSAMRELAGVALRHWLSKARHGTGSYKSHLLRGLMSEQLKRCSRCAQLKSRELFYKQSSSSDGLYSWCKDCHRDVNTAIRLDKLYGLTPEKLAQMVADQDGKCAICGTDPVNALEVDHDHETGRVRQMLCGPCNRLLGLARDDAPLLRRAADYVEHHQAL